jgi:hypothetical protein
MRKLIVLTTVAALVLSFGWAGTAKAQDQYVDSVVSVTGTFGSPTTLSSDPAVAEPLVKGAPNQSFIQISDQNNITLQFTDGIEGTPDGDIHCADLRIDTYDDPFPSAAIIEVSDDGATWYTVSAPPLNDPGRLCAADAVQFCNYDNVCNDPNGGCNLASDANFYIDFDIDRLVPSGLTPPVTHVRLTDLPASVDGENVHLPLGFDLDAVVWLQGGVCYTPPDPLPDDTNSYTQGYYGSSPKGEAEVLPLIQGDEAKCPEFNTILTNVGEGTFSCLEANLDLLADFLTGCVGPGKEKDLCIGFLPSGFEPGQNLAAQKITLILNLNQPSDAIQSGYFINIDPVVDIVEGVPNGTIDPIITTNGELGSCTDSEPDGVCDDGTVNLTLLGEKVTDLDAAGTTVEDILIEADDLLAQVPGDLTDFESRTEDVNGVTLSWDEMTDILGLINESFDKGVPTGFVTSSDVD